MTTGSRLARLAAAVALLAGAWAAGFLLPDLHLALLYLAPALLLATALLAGRYPGEILLERIATRRAAPPDAAPDGRRHHAGCRRRGGARGGQLIARRLAGRAPPCPREV